MRVLGVHTPMQPARVHEPDASVLLLHDNACVRLFPVRSHKISQKDFMVYRIGCSTITTVATSDIGVTAVRLMKRGKTVRQTRMSLAALLGVPEERVDISPVLRALVKARMVRRIDDSVLETESPKILRIVSHNLQFLQERFREWARHAAIRYLPVNTAHRLICFARLRRVPYRQGTTSTNLQDNLHRALGDVLPANMLAATAREYHCEQVARAADVQLLRNLPPPKMTRWLQQGVQITGLEHYRRAQAEGHGVILCGFHFGAPQLLVPFLWRSGISFTGAAAVPPFGGKSLEPKIVLDKTYSESPIPGCGTVTWYTKFSFRGFLEMKKATEKGETVLVFPDGYFSRPNREIATYFGHSAAEFRPAQVVVPFLGHTIMANLMVPWLWQQTRAPLLPVKLLRRNAASFEVIIEPPLYFPNNGGIQSAAERLYGALESDIRLHPASWNYWNRLHELALGSPAEQDKSEMTV